MLIQISKLINKKNNIELKSVPLRIWTNDWSLPKNIKLEGYTITTNTSHRTKVTLNRHALWGEVEDAEDFLKRVYKDKSPKQWGKGKKSGRRFSYRKISNKIWIKIVSKCGYICTEDRKFSFDGRYLRMSLFPKEIALWYLSGDGQVRFIILPKFININDEFLELIGFLDGEMCKKINLNGGSSVKISNSEPVIIKQILNQFNNVFNIPLNFWTASITINNKNLIYNKEDDKEIKNLWVKITGIPIDNFSKTTIQDRYMSNFSKQGIIQIRYSDTLFFLVLLQVMKSIRGVIIKNIKYCAAYIRGIAAGEGGIGKRGNKLRMVHLGSTNEEDKIFYSNCLRNLNISSIHKYPLRIEICGLTNFLILEKINIFKYIPYRKENFLVSLANLKKNYRNRSSALNNN